MASSTSVIALDSQGHVYTCAQQEFVNPALLDDEGGIIEDLQAEWVAQVNARAEVFGLEEGRVRCLYPPPPFPVNHLS